MRIVIDCFKLVKGAGKSIGIYNVALNLVKGLVKEKHRINDIKINNCELIVLGNSFNKEDFKINGIRFIEITNYNPFNKTHCIIWELFSVTKVCKCLDADKIIFPRGYCALFHPIEDIILIHDLIPFYYDRNFPGVFNRLENAYIMKRLKMSSRSCSKIITISNSSKRDILDYCGVDESKITVIYNACSEVNYSGIKEKQDKPYICAITSELPHKNAKGIIESYKKYCEISSKPLNLVIIGLQDVLSYGLPQEIKNKITCYKFIKEDNELYKVIANSELFLFLSLVEGFGLPPIEAMQLNVPVVCSNTSSLPEVTGDAAVLVNPCDYKEVAITIETLALDEEKRKHFVKLGQRNYKRFSQDIIMKQYWNVIL